MITFEDFNLSRSIQDALADMGFTTPTTIQQKAFNVIKSGRDVCGIAQTGTGKTFAYLLPLLQQFKHSKDGYPQMLIIVPTRELVIQVAEAVKTLGAYQNLDVVAIFGGANMRPQMAIVEAGADVIVATPGRLLDAILSGSLKTKNIKKLVIDEMDEMLNLGFRPQIKRVLDLLPPRRQNLLFSATITEEVEALIDTYFNSPEKIEAAPTGTPLEGITQSAYNIPNFYTKVNLVKRLLDTDDTMTKVLIFVSTKSKADELYDELSPTYPETLGVIHSNKEQNHRFRTVAAFKSGEYRAIIATDIIARGIDISEVTHVINFDLPDVPEHYIHRIGRTGRADKKGIAISLITPRDQESQEKIEDLMQRTIPMESLPADLEISDVLTADEQPKVKMKTIQIRIPKVEAKGAAFHEKSAKNSKTNVKVKHSDKMKQKYGKPKKRGSKK